MKPMELSALLTTPERDYAIAQDGIKVKVEELQGKVVCLYFATSSSKSQIDSPNETCRQFTAALARVYNEQRIKDDKHFEVVFVSCDGDAESFEAHFKGMPWLAVPYSDRGRQKLLDELRIESLPRLVVFDKHGRFWYEDDGHLVLELGAEAFNLEKVAKPMKLQTLFGPSNVLLRHEGHEVKISDVREKFIGLFFSSQSSRRARSFTRKLVSVYKELKAQGEDFEIIFISNDHDAAAFTAYFATMPWLALPFEEQHAKANLITHFQVREIPQLIILDASARTITTEGCSLVLQFGSRAFPFTKRHIAALRELHEDSSSNNNDNKDDTQHIAGHGTHIWIINNGQPNYQCAVCKRSGSGMAYICRGCSFRMHPGCAPPGVSVVQQAATFQDDYGRSASSAATLAAASGAPGLPLPLPLPSYPPYPPPATGSSCGWLDQLVGPDTKRTVIGSIVAGLLTVVVGYMWPAAGSNPLVRGSSMNESRLQDKSVDELRKLLSDKDAYEKYLHSVEEVKQLDTLRNDLRKSNVNLARHNLGKEAEMAELRNQCMIIRTTELAAAQEKFADVQRREKEILACSSPASLVDRLQEAANQADDESEALHRKFLNGELDFSEFMHKYKQQRILYHRRTLLRLAAIASLPPG